MVSMELLVIDPQHDFCDPSGALYVDGAQEDMSRLADMVGRVGGKLQRIHVTQDSHRIIDIAHPALWVGPDGTPPNPFTLISVQDVENGVWSPILPALRQKVLDYVKGLDAGGRYQLCIWPPHCLIGSKGHMVVPELHKELVNWETKKVSFVNYVTKGSNPWTEHYSAVQAEVTDPRDPSTQLNVGLIDMLKNADTVLIAGEALSHCLANTVRDIAANFSDAEVAKLVLLEDASSSVGGFEQLGTDFVSDMTARGMRTAKTTDF